jgi:stage II sporulation protein AA (anti-sigma F factor antagonist)
VKVAVDTQQNLRRITLEGRLDASGVQQAESEFNAAVASGPNVVVDLSKVPFIASLGIRMLVAASQEQAKTGGKVVLVGPDELTMRILKTTGVDQLMAVRASLAEALKLF